MTRQSLLTDAALRCVIRAEGALDPRCSDRLGGLRIRATTVAGRPATRLSGRLPDQGALVGVLVGLYEFGLALLSVSVSVWGAAAPGGGHDPVLPSGGVVTHTRGTADA